MSYRVFLLAAFAILALGQAPSALAESDRARDLRRQSGLVPYTPPQAFLDGYFLADEMHPDFLFGPVGNFAAGLGCPAAWLVEEGDKDRQANSTAEYSLTLEVDCPQGVTHYVFVDQSAMTAKDWFAWRRKFHGSKAAPEYGETGARLEKAASDGYPVAGELRFVSRDGQLDTRPPQDLLSAQGCPPRYDCAKGAPTGK